MHHREVETSLRSHVVLPARCTHVWPFAAGLALLVGSATLASIVWALAKAPHRESHINISFAQPVASVEHAPRLPPVAGPSVWQTDVPAPQSAEPVTPAQRAVATAPARPTPRHGEFALVFELGGHGYAAIDKLSIPDDAYPDGVEAALPPHHAYTFIGDEHTAEGAIARLRASDLPADVQAWRDRAVIVEGRDGGTCHAQVSDIALVVLISGSYDYYLMDGDVPTGADEITQAEIRNIVAHGAHYYAARLEGCDAETRDGGIARLDHLPESVPARVHTDRDELIERARQRLIASRAGERAQLAYEDTGSSGRFHTDEYAVFQGQVVSHPRTGETMVSIHAVVDYGCGGADINLWGTYRVEPSGEITAIRVQESGDIMSLGRPVDLDGDGTFEFPATTYLGDRVILAADGTRLRTLEVPFYGCPC